MRPLAFFLCAMVAGCATAEPVESRAATAEEPESPTTENRGCIRVDSEMAAEWQELVIEAAEMWFASVPELACEIAIVDDAANVFAVEGAEHAGRTSGDVVYIDPVSLVGTGHDPLPMVAHELGHLLSGLEGLLSYDDPRHHHEGNGVMTPYLYSLAGEVTAEDAEWMRAAITMR